MPPAGKKKSDKMYAWTELRNGGEAGQIDVAGGRGQRFVIKSRNIVKQGEEVSQADLGVDDAMWQEWIDSGSIRNYPLPEGTDAYTSPAQAFVSNISTGRGDLDVNKIMELGLSHPAALAPDDEAPAEEAAPEGV